jgi:hypothetical protein
MSFISTSDDPEIMSLQEDYAEIALQRKKEIGDKGIPTKNTERKKRIVALDKRAAMLKVLISDRRKAILCGKVTPPTKTIVK